MHVMFEQLREYATILPPALEIRIGRVWSLMNAYSVVIADLVSSRPQYVKSLLSSPRPPDWFKVASPGLLKFCNFCKKMKEVADNIWLNIWQY